MELECYSQIGGDRFTVLLDDTAQLNRSIVGIAADRSKGVRACLGNLCKEMEVAGGESSGGVNDALNCRAIAAAKRRPQLDGEVGECSLDRDRGNPMSRLGRKDLDAVHEELSGACGAQASWSGWSGRRRGGKYVASYFGLLARRHILVFDELTFTSVGKLIFIGGFIARTTSAALTLFGDIFLMILIGTLDSSRVIFHCTQNGPFTLAPRVIFLVTSPTMGRLANEVASARILGESRLGLARVCRDLLPAIGHGDSSDIGRVEFNDS